MRDLKFLLVRGIVSLCAFPTFLFGQFLLFQSPAGTEIAKIHFSTPAGDQDTLAQPASNDPGITVVLNSSVLSGPDAQAANTGLLSFFAKPRTTPLDIVSLTTGQEPQTITAATRQQFVAGMKTLSSAAVAQVDSLPISFNTLLTYLQTFPTSSASWKQVIFVGAEPAVPPALREYSYGILLRTLATRRIRLSHYRPHALTDTASSEPPAWNSVLAATGGSFFDMNPAASTDVSAATWVEAQAPGWAPPAGFRVIPLAMRTDGEASARTVPWIWGTEEKPLPSPAEYADFQERRATVTRTLAGAAAPLPPDAIANLPADLTSLLALNPYDLESLNLATDFADRTRDYESAARNAARVAELEPGNGSNFSRLGFYAWQTGDAAGAERDLLRARELQSDHPQSAAILGEIRWARKDYAAAATDYQEAVRREPDRVELWLRLADTQQMRGRKPDVALALEEVLRRKPATWDRRTQIIDYYLEASDRPQALRHVRSSIPLLPADAPLVTRFAVYSESLEQPQDAIRLWSRVIELDRANEPAYYAIAKLESRAGAWDKALAAAEAGVAAAPNSARLYAMNVDALTALGRIDDARRLARTAADRISDSTLFGRTADFEDRYGRDSPRYYRSLVETMRAGSEPEAVWHAAAERGLMASIREQQSANCAWFAALIASKLCAPDTAPATTPTVQVTGGMRALLFVAHGPQKSSPKAFLADFSRSLAANQSGMDPKSAETYRATLIEYFRLVAELKAMGSVDHGKTLVRLSLQENKAKSDRSSQVTEQVLTMLGWHSRRQNGKLVVEQITKGQNAGHQALASALAIDVVAMQENLQTGGEFVLEIPEEKVEIFPEEGVWQSQFYSGERYTAGFIEALVRKPEMASLYSALSNMEPSSASLLVASGMKYMAEKYGKLLTLYSSCLEIVAGRVEVPGGDSAFPIWTALANVSPNDSGRFLRALLEKDDGRLLHFYFLLSQLDYNRQRFFTANQKRTTSFYEVFRQSTQIGGRQSRDYGSASLEDLFRELPLDEQGRMLFPGGPEVWLVAKNKSTSVASTDRRAGNLSRVATPEVEDDILLRLIHNEYEQTGTHMGAWENFLAVVRVEATRPEPLDSASALLLTEKYAADRGLYGYFAGLTALGAAQYREVLSFGEKVRSLDRQKSDIAVGLLESVLYLLSAAERSGRVAPPKCAALLQEFASSMNRALLPSQWSRAALDFLGVYMDAGGAPRTSPSLRDILVPAAADETIALTEGHSVNPRDALRKSYSRVLELQKIPPLDELLKMHAALLQLASMKDDPRLAVTALVETSEKIQDVELPKKPKLPDYDLELLKSSERARFTDLNAQLQKEIAKKKIDPKHLQTIAEEFWDALAYRTLVALTGQIYASNFRPDDLLVAEDPLLVRKHRFVVWEATPRQYFATGDMAISSEAGGSRVTGGFDGISTVAGQAAARSLRDVDATVSFIAPALLGSLRATDWSGVDQTSLRGVAARIHAAQDWLVLAATQPRVYESVSTATYGLLSLNRRARLLLALRTRDWDSVWSSMSLTDLFFLAGRLRTQPAGEAGASPAIKEFRASAAGLPKGTDVMGPTFQHLRRRLAPAMVEMAPYEDVATEQFPAFLAERIAEFKIYLVRLFAEQALPASALPSVAEPAARAVLGDIQMTNLKDWPAVLDAYEGFDGPRLKEVMGTL